MNTDPASPFPARGRREMPATPRALLAMALALGVVAAGASALAVATLRGDTSGGVVIGIAWVLIAGGATLISARFGALGRTAARSCELGHGDFARAVCVGRESGPLVKSSPRVVTASDLGILILRARLFGDPDVIASIPYRGIVRCQSTAASLELGTVRGELMRFSGVMPSQGAAFERMVAERLAALPATR